MRAEIISVGTELLLGDIVNTNARFLAQELASLGFGVYYQSVVGDNPMRLRSMIQTAKERSDVLLFTGGLGPTEDDLTKETVAEMYGDSLILDTEELANIEKYFAKTGRHMTPNNRKQAMVPVKGHKLPNENGTAPGAVFRQGNRYAILLPGPPREMEPMFTQQVRPLLEGMQEQAIRSITLRVVGVGESELENRIYDLLSGSNPTAALYAKTGEVHIRITARAATATQADLLCAQQAGLFRAVLGDVIYSETGQSLEEIVVQSLREHHQTLATAESCTGGLLSERITSVPGSSDVFGFGVTTYANEVKHELLGVRYSTLRQHGAVSSQVAAEMALGAQDRGVADYGIGITGVAGPGGGTEEKPVGLVYVALARARQVFVKRLVLPNRGREMVRMLATQHALDMVRRQTEGLPIADAKQFGKNEYADYERAGKPRKRGGALWRTLIALFLVAVLVVTLVLVQYWGQDKSAVERGTSPSSQGLRYGTAEFTAAACALVAKAAQQNPAVVGFVALPNGSVEQLVGRAGAAQAALQNPDDTPGMSGMAALPTDAAIGAAGHNTLLLGGEGLSGLSSLRNTGKAGDISTFTYFTARDARVFRVYSVLLADEDEQRRDGFSPGVSVLQGYQTYLTFILGAQARSLYDIPIDLAPEDSYMTIGAIDPQVPGRRLLLCGRQLRANEKPEAIAASPAGNPLMPMAYYKEIGETAPGEAQLWEYWMRRFLTRNITNPALQAAGQAPDEDKIPMVPAIRAASAAAAPAAASGALLMRAAAQSEPVKIGNILSGLDWSSPLADILSQITDTPSSSSVVSSKAVASSKVSSSQVVSSSELAASASVTSASVVAPSLLYSSTVSSSMSGSDAESAFSSSGSHIESGSDDSVVSSGIVSSAPRIPMQRASAGLLTVNMNGEVITAATKDVLAWICQRECGWLDAEAIKAQAVAAHSWILNQQGAGNRIPSVVGAMPGTAVRKAVEGVAHQVVSADENTPAFTPYSRMAANGTNTAQDMWGVGRAYLKHVPSVPEQSRDDWRVMLTLSTEEIAVLALQNAGVELTQYEDPNTWFSEPEKNEGGYVMSIQLGGQAFTGAEFWQQVLVRQGVPLLRSPAFEIEYSGEKFLFTSYGEGHGCGMSQVGAGALAREGWSYSRILEQYYPGTKLLAWE